MNRERARRKVLCSGIEPQRLKHLSCFREELLSEKKIFGALNTLAMGDAQAVSFAQTSHLSLALRWEAAAPSNLVTLNGPVPRGADFVGIIIDDYIAGSIQPVGAPLPSHGYVLRERMEKKYSEVDLISHREKGFFG